MRAAGSHARDHITKSAFEKCRPFPFVRLTRDRFGAAVIDTGPGKPITIHLVAERYDHRLAKSASRVRPVIDVTIPRAGEDGVETETIRSLFLFVRPIPWGPKNERERTVPPDHFQVGGGKTLFSPVAGGRDDGLMFPDHFFEVLDRLERDRVFRFAEIDERARVGTVLWKEHLHGSVRV